MFLFLSKLLPLFVYPLGLACLLLAAALIVRGRRVRQAAGLLALLVLLLFGNRPVANRLVSSLEWQYLPATDPPQVDAIVLLGGGTRPALAPRLQSEVNEAGDRMVYAARLYRAGKSPVVVVSGGFIEFLGSTVPEAAAMQELLGLLGVPDEAIWQEAESRNTYENALFVRELLAPKGLNRILLVTSALHMPRSVRIFVKQGFDVIPAPTDYLTTYRDERTAADVGIGGRLLALVPSAESLELSTRALKEYIGMAIYRLRGWL
jgi:uncharacterized SAM-binding protein YcdF (DUF218 family)